MFSLKRIFAVKVISFLIEYLWLLQFLLNNSVNVIIILNRYTQPMHQSRNNPHILQEISINILTKMADIIGSLH